VPVITDTLLRRNCVRHLSVVNSGSSGPGRLVHAITLLPVAQAVAVARDWSRETLTAWMLDELADVVPQLVSELVTNSIEHADTARVRAALMRTSDTLRVNVADDDAYNLPACRQAGPDDIRGRGLAIVEALSDRWGITVADEGKSVWCEVSLPHATQADVDLRISSRAERSSATWISASTPENDREFAQPCPEALS
jgi:serine/threonine-protein kinase RsbW